MRLVLTLDLDNAALQPENDGPSEAERILRGIGDQLWASFPDGWVAISPHKILDANGNECGVWQIVGTEESEGRGDG